MTKLLYLHDLNLLHHTAQVLSITRENDKDVVVLDQTIFYPQGGGQPYDTGVIESNTGKFLVEEVRFIDGAVKHIGIFQTDTFSIGEIVKCTVDSDRRKLLARIHSAGHLVDRAIAELKLPWKPGKGYHFPNGPYDEYEGSLDGLDKEKLLTDIQNLCNEYVQRGSATEILFMTREKMNEVCHYTPDFPAEKGNEARVIVNDGFYMPCGGTPVSNIADVGIVTIRKIKKEKDAIRVSYDVSR